MEINARKIIYKGARANKKYKKMQVKPIFTTVPGHYKETGQFYFEAYFKWCQASAKRQNATPT